MKNYKQSVSLIVGVLATIAFGSSAHAQASDALIDKLVDKGILSVKEANELREEADKDFTKAYAVKSGMSEWVNALKWNGDFRGRYDGIFQDNNNFGPKVGSPNSYANHNRDRFRYRARFGLTASMTDDFEVGLRLGSGEIGSAAPSLGGSPFSANTTVGNDGSRKFIFVDLAYAKWTPKNWFQVEIGKMTSPFWFTDMVFDPDYNPEGAQQKLTYDINDDQKISFNTGQYVIAENFSGSGSGVNTDAYLFINQLDWSARWSPKISSRLGIGMMNFLHQNSISPALETFINQNGTPASGIGAQKFNPIIARGELAYTLESFPFFSGEFPIAVGAEYVNNPAASSQSFPGKTYSGKANEAYNFGLQLGNAKARGNWQIAYNYKNIETASTWHGLNDDDFGFNGRGGTDVRGHQVKAAYHIYDPFTLGLSYYNTEQIANAPGTKAHQQRLFVDFLLTF
ncbi:MAG: hypothetical protein JWQ71_4711 [Pedosphaera sp.]|nr:hypothetical protein [Pedosphaera sp.]